MPQTGKLFDTLDVDDDKHSLVGVPDPTPFYLSKSVWLGVLLTLIGAATYVSDPSHVPTMTVASVSAFVAGILQVILRVWFTAAPIEGTAKAKRYRSMKRAALSRPTHLP